MFLMTSYKKAREAQPRQNHDQLAVQLTVKTVMNLVTTWSVC